MPLIATCWLSAMGLSAWLGYLAPWLAAWYLIASTVTYVAYWQDKMAARKQHTRIPERTLLLLGLLGGWPGAQLAQQWHHHKTKKITFQRLFWITVLINITLLSYGITR